MTVHCSLVFVICLLAGQSEGSEFLMQAVSLGIGTLQQSPTGAKLARVATALQDSPNQIYGQINSASKMIDGSLNLMSDTLDAHGLEEILKQLLDLNTLPKRMCVPGMKMTAKETGDLIIPKGSLLNNKEVSVVANVIKEIDAERQQVNIDITFPDLYVNYVFAFKHFSRIRKDRQGNIVVTVPGPNKVVVTATVSKTRSKVDAKVKGRKCFLTVSEVKVEVGNGLEISDFEYDSLLENTFGFSTTKPLVKDMVKNSFNHILDHVKKSLKVMAERALTMKSIYCDKEGLGKAESVDCKQLINYGEYKAPSN